jgi:hypothetical protein
MKLLISIGLRGEKRSHYCLLEASERELNSPGQRLAQS